MDIETALKELKISTEKFLLEVKNFLESKDFESYAKKINSCSENLIKPDNPFLLELKESDPGRKIVHELKTFVEKYQNLKARTYYFAYDEIISMFDKMGISLIMKSFKESEEKDKNKEGGADSHNFLEILIGTIDENVTLVQRRLELHLSDLDPLVSQQKKGKSNLTVH